MEETPAPKEPEASTEPQTAKSRIVVGPAPQDGRAYEFIIMGAVEHHPAAAKGKKKRSGETPGPEGRGKERTNLG